MRGGVPTISACETSVEMSGMVQTAYQALTDGRNEGFEQFGFSQFA